MDNNTSARSELDRLTALIASKNNEIERLQSSLQSSRDQDSPNRQQLGEIESELAAAR